jgi:hypothetical protein
VNEDRATTTLCLPADFVQRVLADVRFHQRRQRIHRVVTGALLGALVLSFSLASGRGAHHPNVSARRAAGVAYTQAGWDSTVDQLAHATEPDQLDDYLMPAASLDNLDANYSSALSTDEFDWES